MQRVEWGSEGKNRSEVRPEEIDYCERRRKEITVKCEGVRV